MFLTTKALILRETKYKESDKILTLLTEHEGKMTAKARGVLRPKSKLSSAVQLFSYSEVTMFGSNGRWTVNEASTVEEFRGLRTDIKNFAMAGYFSEMLEAVSDEDFPNPSILQLGLNSLYALANGLFDSNIIKAVFELRLAGYAGYRPEIFTCSDCGLSDFSSCFLFPEDGVVSCETCKNRGGMVISEPVLAAMRYILDANEKKIFSFNLDQSSIKSLSAVCEAYVLTALGREFRSLDYLRRITRNDRDQ